MKLESGYNISPNKNLIHICVNVIFLSAVLSLLDLKWGSYIEWLLTII